MYIVNHTLSQLKEYGLSFKSVYNIITENYSTEVFSEHLENNTVVKTTYSELFKKVDLVADIINSNYQNSNSKIIGIYLENSPQWVACFWGILKAGFIPLLLNTRQDISSSEYVIENTNPVFVFSESSDISKGITIDEFFGKSHTEISSQNWEDRIIMVTSGSTATPKIICHNGHSICSQIELTGDIVKINPTIKHDRKLNVRILAFLPFYHVFGLVSTMMWFTFFGRTLIFLPDYNPNTIQEVCRNQNVSHFFATPLVWDKVVKNLLREVEVQGKTDLFNKMINFSNKLQTVFPHIGVSIIRNTVFKKVRKQALGTNLHFLISGGGFISPETLRVLNGLGYSLYNGYGLTECGILSVNLSRKAQDRLTTNCGPLFSNVNYRINENSQLEIANNNTFIGTYKNGEFIEFNEEFINTNDIVELDSKNRLKVIGRNDDVIVTSGGENLSPEAIEEKLDSSEFETATILYGRINNKEQLILALSYSSNNSALYLANALDKLYKSIEKLPLIERPTAVIRIIDEIPFSLKSVDRKELKRRIDSNSIFYEACSISATENMAHYEDKEYREIMNTVKSIFAKATNTPVEKITDTVDFVNAGGDSLGYFELLAEIKEQTGVEIDTDSNLLLTPMSFANYIYQHKESK